MQWLRDSTRFARRVADRFVSDACAGRAAGLAFSTLFALVPLGAVVIALLSAFDSFSGLLSNADLELLRELIPTASEEILSSLTQFSENARALGFSALTLFAFTAVLLVRGIHRTLNAVWDTAIDGGIWHRFATYTTVIVLGTALLAGTVVAGPLLNSVLSLGNSESILRPITRGLMPPVLIFLTFFLTYILVPSTDVRPRYGFYAALIATGGWIAARSLFVFWTGSVMRLSLIYGSLAAVPLFLIWLYITWLIVLLGAEASVEFQRGTATIPAGPDDLPGVPISVPGLSMAVVETIDEIAARFEGARETVTEEWLTRRYGVGLGTATVEALLETGWVARSEKGLLPVRSLGSMDAAELAEELWLARDDSGRVRMLLVAWAEAQVSRRSTHGVVEGDV